MYVIAHESRDSKRKYMIHYDPMSSKFFLENELHEMMEIDELLLFNTIDALFKEHF